MYFLSALESVEFTALFTLIQIIMVLATLLVGYIFKSIAIYTMAKKRKFKNLWLAFVPFANWILIGKLIGTAIVWGMKFKNIGVFTAITSFLMFVINIVLNFAYYKTAVEVIFNVTITFTSPFMNSLIEQDNMLYLILSSVSFIFELANIFFEVSTIHLIFRQYKPERVIPYTLISIFIDFMFGILLFTIRNNEKSTYEDFLRKKAEERRAYYTQNYNSYSGYNPYNNVNNNKNSNEGEQKDENPFPEFDDKKDNGNDYFS